MLSLERRLGIAAGFLLGDAMGQPFHALKGGHIQQLAGGRVEGFLSDPVLQPDRPDRNCLPGLHCSGGQTFLAALAGAADDATGRVPLARAAGALRELTGDASPDEGPTHGALRRPGRPLARALARWAETFPWELEDHLAPDEQSEGLGAAPFVLGNLVATGGVDLDAARLTHLREPALVGALTLGRAAQLLAACENSRRIDVEAFVVDVASFALATEDALRDGAIGARWKELEWGYPRARLSRVIALLPKLIATGDNALAERTLVAAATEFAPTRPVAHGSHGFAPMLVPWVLYHALGPLSPTNALEEAVNGGGETPLIASLVGALAGARWGVGHFDEGLLAQLLAWRDACALVESPTPAVAEAWIADESTWTAREEAMRAPLRKAHDKARVDAPPKKAKPKPVELPPQGELPFAPPPQVWLEQRGDELAPWEKQRLKAERGRKRIDWKEEQRAKRKLDGE